MARPFRNSLARIPRILSATGIFPLGMVALMTFHVDALEVQGFLTEGCQKKIGVTVHVTEDRVEFVNLAGDFETLDQDKIEAIAVFNVIDNPIPEFHIDEKALARLKAVYLDDSGGPRTLAFPVRFIEDLLIFFSLDGKSHVQTYGDIYKLRPAGPQALGKRTPKSWKAMSFDFSDQSSQCPSSLSRPGDTKPTRILADKISIAEFLHSFESGYESLESFQERTYLYAKPYLYERKTRLGLVFQGQREEPGILFPLYFQWSSGEPYRFQSFNVFGLRSHEFVPTTEPVFAIRSDVKSHIFHGLFIGNMSGLTAGNPIFLNDGPVEWKGASIEVQPTFNYLAMMGGDFGPYSLSVGFYFPTFGIKVKDEYREVLGSSMSYAFRAMYTRSHFSVRAVSAITSYSKANAGKQDALARTGTNGAIDSPSSFDFNAVFLRGGFDYSFSDRLKVGADGILVQGGYKEVRGSQPNDLRFRKVTGQVFVRQSFSDYIALTGFVNLIQNNYETNFLSQPQNREQREARFFGTLEFVF